MFKKGTGSLCGKKGHFAKDCWHILRPRAITVGKWDIWNPCFYEEKPVQKINCIPGSDPVRLALHLNWKLFRFKVDSGAKDNFYSRRVWARLGRPTLHPAHTHYIAASGAPISILGTFTVKVSIQEASRTRDNTFNAFSPPHLNLLGLLEYAG